MISDLLQGEFAPLRKIFFLYIRKIKSEDTPIKYNRYKKLLIICCEEIDKETYLSESYRRDLKKALKVLLSKVSRDQAYEPLANRIINRIKEDETKW